MGFAASYFIFVATNLRDLLMMVTNCHVQLELWTLILIQVAIYVPLSWVRQIKKFGTLALVADVFILMGLVYIVYYSIDRLITIGHAPGESEFRWFNPTDFPLFVGTSIFAFEGIGLMLPIARSMKHPEKFPSILTLTMILMAGCFVGIGALCYYTFGRKVETVVFLNMPAHNPIVEGLQFLYALAIMFSFPLCVYPPIRITEQYLFATFPGGRHSPSIKWAKNGYRTFIVFLLAGISILGSSNLDKFVALIGSFACIPLSFIYPALFHYKSGIGSVWTRSKDFLIVFLGLAAMLYTTWITLWVWATEEPDVPVNRCVGQ